MRSQFIRTASIICILSMVLAGCGSVPKSDQKKEVKSFANKIYQQEQSITKDLSEFVDVFSQLEEDEGNVNLGDLSTISKALKRDYLSVHTGLSKMKSPKSLPSDLSDLLNSGAQELSSAYLERSQGLDSLIKFSNYQSPSELIDFQKNMAKTQSELQDAKQKIKEASKKVGLNK
ncbi:MAG: hypothetical protein Q8934_08580 [Bacillota bacterium]|nr:hypothetical protein [Bacillota bacterium]